MFDELKEVKHFNEITNLNGLIIQCLKHVWWIKRSKAL